MCHEGNPFPYLVPLDLPACSLSDKFALTQSAVDDAGSLYVNNICGNLQRFKCWIETNKHRFKQTYSALLQVIGATIKSLINGNTVVTNRPINKLYRIDQ